MRPVSLILHNLAYNLKLTGKGLAGRSRAENGGNVESNLSPARRLWSQKARGCVCRVPTWASLQPQRPEEVPAGKHIVNVEVRELWRPSGVWMQNADATHLRHVVCSWRNHRFRVRQHVGHVNLSLEIDLCRTFHERM